MKPLAWAIGILVVLVATAALVVVVASDGDSSASANSTTLADPSTTTTESPPTEPPPTTSTSTSTSTTTTTTTTDPSTSTTRVTGGESEIWVLGFSQTAQWCVHTNFHCLAVSGASITWWKEWRPAVAGLADYEAIDGVVVYTITGGSSDWVSVIHEVVDTLQREIPNHTVLYLQAVVGGPDHDTICPEAPRSPQNHVASWEAAVEVAGEREGVEAIFHPHVGDCAEYRDTLGHLDDSTDVDERVAAEAKAAYG